MLEAAQEALLEHGRVVQLLEEEGVLQDARDAKVGGPRAHGDDEPVKLKLGGGGARLAAGPIGGWGSGNGDGGGGGRRGQTGLLESVRRQEAGDCAALQVHARGSSLHKGRGGAEEGPDRLDDVPVLHSAHRRPAQQGRVEKKWARRDDGDVVASRLLGLAQAL